MTDASTRIDRRPADAERPRWFRRQRPRVLVVLAGVAILYAATQLVLFDHQRFLEYDESQYLAEVDPDVQPDVLGAHRARGITLLVAPPALLGADLATIRLYLIVLSSALLYLAFRPWVLRLGTAGVVAAAVFASCWLALFYGSEISPNLFVAFTAVAATGYLERARDSGWSSHLLPVGFAMAFMALLRPSDSIWAAAGLGVSVLTVMHGGIKGAVRAGLAIAAGTVVGWIPWVVEAWLRFGGPLRRLERAAELTSGSGVTTSFWEHIELADGPLMGPQTVAGTPVAGIAWWIAVALLVIAAMRTTRGSDHAAGVRMAAMTALAMAVPYFFLADVLAPRFLLPTYALVSMPAAVGLLTLASAAPRRFARPGALVVICLVVAWGFWGVRTARAIEAEATAAREESRQLGRSLAAAVDGPPCTFVSQYGYPQIAYASGCHGSRFDVTSTEIPTVFGEPVGFVFAVSEPAPGSPVENWLRVPVPQPTQPGWVMYVAPEES